ncbi:hypothetical protein M9H77_06948 [Catharanthus roseus]|uniref:Uncharacterized protein n=1 Tax=Catharanthus roseus TaxID=4058 RepID=A0ACC0BTI9_CATRO|nr:hypothetical protein M9H77_06948 [Catharanthus roseus]
MTDSCFFTTCHQMAVPFESRNDENETKIEQNDKNGSRRQSSRTYCRWQDNLPSTVGAKNGQAICNPRPTTDSRPHPTVSGRLFTRLFGIEKEEQSRATNWGLIGAID